MSDQTSNAMHGYNRVILESFLLAASGKTDSAILRAEEYVTQHQHDGWAHDGLGLLYATATMIEPALRSFAAATRCMNAVATFHIHLAQMFTAIIQPRSAAQVLRIALEKFGPLASIRINLAFCLAQSGAAEESYEIFSELIESQPTNPQLLRSYALGMRQAGRLGWALDAFERASDVDPDFLKEFYKVYSNLLVAAGRATEAQIIKNKYGHRNTLDNKISTPSSLPAHLFKSEEGKQRPRRTSEDTFIVIRGALTEDQIDIVKHYGITNDAFIVLSTWDETTPAILREIRPFVDEIILNKRPETPGWANINNQLVCGAAGVSLAKRHGAKRILVTRTDIALCNSTALADLENILEKNRIKNVRVPGLNQRLVICELFTQAVPFYHASDIMCYGTADDVTKYWSLETMSEQTLGPEITLCRAFAKRVGRSLTEDFEDSVSAIRDLFIVEDSTKLRLYWQRYPDANNGKIQAQRLLITHDIWAGKAEPSFRVDIGALPMIDPILLADQTL